jgi:hypothetical protein
MKGRCRMGRIQRRRAMKYKTWECKIVVPMDAQLPEGFNSPPRRAAIDAVTQARVPVLACFSGWGGKLTPTEKKIVDDMNRGRTQVGTVSNVADKVGKSKENHDN